MAVVTPVVDMPWSSVAGPVVAAGSSPGARSASPIATGVLSAAAATATRQRDEHAVGSRRGRESSAQGDAGVRGGEGGDLLERALDRLDVEVGAEAVRQLGREHPVAASGARRRDLLIEQRHAAFDVGRRSGRLGPARRGEHDVGLPARVGEEGVDGDDGAGAGDGPSGEIVIGEVDRGVGAEQHEHVDLAVGRGRQHAGGVEPGGGGQLRPAVAAERLRAVGQGRAAGEQARREAHLDGAPGVGAPQHREERGVGLGLEQQRGRLDHRGGRLGDRRPSHDGGDRARGHDRLGGIEVAPDDCTGVAARRPARTTSCAAPGRQRSDAVARFPVSPEVDSGDPRDELRRCRARPRGAGAGRGSAAPP